MPHTGSTSIVVLSVRILKSLLLYHPRCTFAAVTADLKVAHLVSCEAEHSPSGFFFFFFFFFFRVSAGFRFDKDRCTCEKDILNLSFPVRKAGGSDFKTVHFTYPFFFFFFFFFFNSFSMIFFSPQVP